MSELQRTWEEILRRKGYGNRKIKLKNLFFYSNLDYLYQARDHYKELGHRAEVFRGNDLSPDRVEKNMQCVGMARSFFGDLYILIISKEKREK